eukprot:6245618-Pyramimonas_sp.AAC.1
MAAINVLMTSDNTVGPLLSKSSSYGIFRRANCAEPVLSAYSLIPFAGPGARADTGEPHPGRGAGADPTF